MFLHRRNTLGIFGDKLLFKVNGSSLSSGQIQLNIVKHENKVKHLLPFSCCSILGSQLSILTPPYPSSLSKRLITFINQPIIKYKTNSLVTGFILEVYKDKGGYIYNQFDPVVNTLFLNFKPIETDIEQILINYIMTVFENLDAIEQSNLRIFLLATIMTYQNMIIPIIRKIDMNDYDQRARLARTINDFSTSFLKAWDEPKPLAPGSQIFTDRIRSTSEFQDWLE
jgi:hypothetical protein